MINAEKLEKAVMEGFFEVLSSTESFQKVIFDGNPVGRVAEDLKKKEKKLQDGLKPVEKKIANLVVAIENFDDDEMGTFLQRIKSKFQTLKQKKKDLEFEIQTIQNQLMTLPTEPEIINLQDRTKELLKRQHESYLRCGGPFHSLPFLEKKKIIMLYFSGKDITGKKYGIYIKYLGGDPRMYQFKAYGKFGYVHGEVEGRSSYYDSYPQLSPTKENELLSKEATKIVLKENPELTIKEHILSIDQY